MHILAHLIGHNQRHVCFAVDVSTVEAMAVAVGRPKDNEQQAHAAPTTDQNRLVSVTLAVITIGVAVVGMIVYRVFSLP